jgi:uncharacterized protein YqgC (DUF456 family)
LAILLVGVYAYFMPAERRVDIGWGVIIGLLVMAVLGEVIEFLAAALGATKAGGSKRGAVLALIGSLLGGVMGLFIPIPPPVIGSMIGALLFASLGALGGAMLGEQWKGRDFDESLRVGHAAFWGRLLGTLGKVLVGCVMLVLVVAAVLLR